MSEQLKALYALQEVDLKLDANRKTAAALDTGAALRQQLAAAEVQRKKYQDELHGVEAELKDAELELRSVEQKKTTFEKKLYGGQVVNPKELSAMEKEIELLGKKREELDGKILALYDQVEQKRTTLKDFERRIEAASQRLEKIAAKYETESSRLAQEQMRLEAERVKEAESIEPPLLRRYESIRSRANGVGIAKIVDGKCGACHVGMTAYALKEARKGNEPTYCENCGRLLLPENE